MSVCGNPQCCSSTGLAGEITHGWGRLDKNGYWEHSCPDPRHEVQDRELGFLPQALPTLIMTVGLPRSGKSTWAKAQGLPIVNPDSIRLAIHGQAFYGPAEPLVWATAKIMVKSLFLAGSEFVILDATNLTDERRREWRSPDWGVLYKVFPADAETCKYRARTSGKEYLVEVIDRMVALGIDPVPAEGRI